MYCHAQMLWNQKEDIISAEIGQNSDNAMDWQEVKLYVCMLGPTEGSRQSCVYANSSNQDMALRGKQTPNEIPHASNFAALNEAEDEGELLSRNRPEPVQWLAD